MALSALTPAALSPWPDRADGQRFAQAWIDSTETLADAVGITVPALTASDDPGTLTDDEIHSFNYLDRLGSAAAGMVESYAADAPDQIKSEAVIRVCAYLVCTQTPERATDISQLKFEPIPANTGNAFRFCGAAKLLSPYRTRGAAVLSEDES